MNKDNPGGVPSSGSVAPLSLAMQQLFVRAITSREPIDATAEAARIFRELPLLGRTVDEIRREIVAAAIARGIPIQL
ncbi:MULTISPECIES: hypothetical protein [unclassified Chelatococcus]|uniref:hypothetical protein n=1 Tax=unclassified Chelatococcus TaxID=2638111 RepID=UPI001BCE64E4|nr:MULTISPECIES: hypothetical protein [unclassified Chelatococcus]CAH1657950.1 conserved hypothetical protein [Hyphomicrobiales bacterium]MBS7742237.1 hypothetical protein [Chelatococcus sp. HY11]MBX3542645.1 hypothetical protein [Chelatococcus sp.]MCO5075139.1 hypothetical protein [Chelatococcus sp.]CAH1689472.1 conserved hypothetical protein [Hyphomicrobiales bacterium]